MNTRDRGPVLVFFHPARIALNIEVKEHPRLRLQIADLVKENPQAEVPEILGVIAAYCGIALDGMYSQEDLDALCNILVQKLRDKRSIVIH